MSRFEESREAKRNKAVALSYRAEEDMAPVVVASGYGQIADKIIGIAEEKGIPVFKDDSAASMLCMLEIGRSIPPELYQVVAAVYMQILNVSQKLKAGNAPGEAPPPGADALQKALEDARRAREDAGP